MATAGTPHSGAQTRAGIVARGPVIEEIRSAPSPSEVFEVFKDEPFAVFLDSGMDPERLGRYSFIVSEPFLTMRSKGRRITLAENGTERTVEDNPFDLLGELLGKYRLERGTPPVPFTGGAVGYLGYDLGRFIEKLPQTAKDDLELPECYFGFYDRVIAFDNLLQRAFLVSTGFPELDEPKQRERAAVRLRDLKDKLESVASGPKDSSPAYPGASKVQLRSNFTREAYLQAVERARQYIIAGDIFEVNLSQRLEADLTVPPYALFRRLRQINPAPFAAYLNFEGVQIAGASPERFLRLQGDRVETRPIKGTRPRGKTPAEDAALAAELVNSAKDRAENMMIVDLERNDLGRLCRYGTVQVTELAKLETFPSVFHLTSTVEGRLCEGKNAIDLLKATFPGGSITGAPKVRAMEIIEELELTRRSVYTGSVGYLGFNGDMDINIVIRTFIIKGNTAYFQVGGAVVYDSEPAMEYDETMHKARALIDALNAPEVAGG